GGGTPAGACGRGGHPACPGRWSRRGRPVGGADPARERVGLPDTAADDQPDPGGRSARGGSSRLGGDARGGGPPAPRGTTAGGGSRRGSGRREPSGRRLR